MPNSPGNNNLQRTNASGLSPATSSSSSSLGAAQPQQQQQVQRPRAPPSISSSISSDRPAKPTRTVSFTPEVSRAQAGTASLADFLRSTGPDPPPIAAPQLPASLPPQQLQPNPPALASSSLGKKSGGGIFNLGRKKTATRTSSDAGGGASSSSSAGGASMASGGIANVRGVETVVTASGQTVNIIPYKPPHLPPLAGSESLDSIAPTPSIQQDLYRISGHPYLSSTSSPSAPPERSPARVPRSGSQGALDLLSQAGKDARAAEASSRASGAGMRRSQTTPNVSIQPSSSSPSRQPQPPQSNFSQTQLAPPIVTSPPQGQASRRPATSSGSPSASPSRAAGGAASPHRPPRTPPTSRRPSTAPDEPTQQFTARKISSSGPSVTTPVVLSASIVPQQHQSSSSYTPHSIQVGRADSPTDPTLSPPVQLVPLGIQTSDDGRGGELVGLGNSRQQRIQEQISSLELLGQRIEADEDGNVMVGRRVERRHIAVQVGTSLPVSSLKRAESGDETTKGERKAHVSGASSSSISMKDGNDNSKTPTITSSLALAGEDRGPDSSPEMFSTPTGSSEGTFVSTHSTHSGESLLASGGNTIVTTAPTTASSSTTSNPLTASTFSTSTSSSTGTSASTSTTHPPPPALPPSRSVPQKSSLSPPSLARPSGGYGSSGVLAKKLSSRPQTSPELSTRGVFGETSNPASSSSSTTVVATTQEEKERERRLTYLEEKVKREVERRKDAEGAMRRLNQATAEQKGRWEDMAGWALDVMERTERERTLLRSDNARLRRELELWKMKAQVAESGQQMDRSRGFEGSGVSSAGEGEGEEEMGGSSY